jgi:hypothetical protein
MTSQKIHSGNADLPLLVSKLVLRDTFALPDSSHLVGRLGQAEIDILKKIVKREIVPAGRVDYAKALTALAGAEQSREVSELLQHFLADEARSPAERAAAAISLNTMPQHYAERALLDNLYVQDGSVQFNVYKSLGQIGGAEALERLSRLPQPRLVYLQKQLDFARALIAFRHDLPGDFLPFRRGEERKPGDPEQMIDLSLRPISAREVTRNLGRYKGSAYGIGLSRNRGFALTAGKARWSVFLNDSLAQEGFASLFTRRKLITGLLARWDDITSTYSPQYIVLSNPQHHSIEIMVVRSDGEVFYSGLAESLAGSVRFEISDVDHPGTAPTTVRGVLNRAGVEFQVSIPFGKRTNKRRAEPVRKVEM